MANIQQYAAVKVKFSDNVEATLSVKLINGDNEDPADVYGSIIGRFSITQQFPIFDRKMEEHIPVRPGQNIPLSISEVTVPTGATDLEIEAYLKDYDYGSPDDEIANGKALFHVKAGGGTEKKIIAGKYGSVEVNVVWE